MSRWAYVFAGLALFPLPFLSVAGWNHDADIQPHSDHQPRHSGLLVMVGDHHLEIVDRGETLEIYPSDARRRALRDGTGRIVLDEAVVHPLLWREDRLVATDLPTWQRARIEVTVEEGTELSVTVPRAAGDAPLGADNP